MGAIGTTEGFTGICRQFLVHLCQIAFGQNNIAVQNNEILSSAALGTIVARLAGAAVRFRVILRREAVCIAFCHVAAGHAGAVLDHNDLKVRQCLAAQARE